MVSSEVDIPEEQTKDLAKILIPKQNHGKPYIWGTLSYSSAFGEHDAHFCVRIDPGKTAEYGGRGPKAVSHKGISWDT
jgi:hypothetical protein